MQTTAKGDDMGNKDVLQPREPLTPNQLREAIEERAMNPAWMTVEELMRQRLLRCSDGRGREVRAGTFGGVMGIFLEALAVIEEVGGRKLGDEEVEEMMVGFVKEMGPMFMHSSSHAMDELGVGMSREGLWGGKGDVVEFLEHEAVGKDPKSKKRILQLLGDHIGCGHIDKLVHDASDYGVRRGLMEAGYSAFWKGKWGEYESRGVGSDMFELEVLQGDHLEQAVVFVWVGEMNPEKSYLEDDELVPVVAPSSKGVDFFVVTPQADRTIRMRVAQQLLNGSWKHYLNRGQKVEFLNTFVNITPDKMLGITASKLSTATGVGALELPMYDVVFRGGEMENTQVRRRD